MGGSLTQPCRVREEGLRGRKPLLHGAKVLDGIRGLKVPWEEGSANSVPAAAVIRRIRALSGFIGFKGCAGGRVSPR